MGSEQCAGYEDYYTHSTAFPIFLLLFYITECGSAGGSIPGVEISMPPSHVALSGDLHIQIASTSFPPLLLQLSRLEGNLAAQPLTTVAVFPEASALARNSTIVKIPCGYFSRGGQYYVLIKRRPIGTGNVTTLDDRDNSVITRSLDVRWPMPQLSLTPEYIQTYPERPVTAILEFPEVVCPPVADSPASAIPEFWLELHYCGHSLLTCDNNDSDKNKTSAQVLYSEQVRGFPGRRVLTLRCELFGLAGHYALSLRPTAPSPALPHTAAYVKADWSEQFVFNVHAHNILPCDVHNGGIAVLFQYPSCILATGDRVRLFARLRANVASLAPPTKLEYVAEQRVMRGRHKMHFDCDLFTERYVEYCFVYVSQAITGAVADVRMDCVPTLPVSGEWRMGAVECLDAVLEYMHWRNEEPLSFLRLAAPQIRCKVLRGKLNALEEFRSQRDDLMRKFENQENEMEAQEKRHKRELYEIERKFIIKRDLLKRDMEAKIRSLSTEFHDTTEMRIAATTHRVIRENIAVNNELDLVLATQQRLYNENCRMKKKDTNLKQQCELLEVEKKSALAKVRVQLKIIERLTDDHKFMANQLEKYKHYEQEIFKSRNEIQSLADKIKKLEFTNRILEQNLHHVRCDRTTLQTEIMYVKSENDHLNDVLKEAVCCIKEALTMSSESDTWMQASRRENLLNSLFTLLCEAREQKMRLPSLETIDSIEATYQRGDLGFVPKPVELRSTVPTRRNMESQTAASFQEYLQFGEVTHADLASRSGILDVEHVVSVHQAELGDDHPSILFFDDTEMIGEEEGSQDFGILALAEEDEEGEGSVTPATETETEKESPTETGDSPERDGQEPSPEPEATSPEVPASEVPEEGQAWEEQREEGAEAVAAPEDTTAVEEADNA